MGVRSKGGKNKRTQEGDSWRVMYGKDRSPHQRKRRTVAREKRRGIVCDGPRERRDSRDRGRELEKMKG